MEKLGKLATPLPSGVAVSVPPSVPRRVAIAAVTTTPAWLTALPDPSRSCTAGCWANATPLCAVADGWVVTLSCVAAPAVIVMAVERKRVGQGKGVDRGGRPVIQQKDRWGKRATPR